MTASAMTSNSAPAERAPRRTPRDAARCIVGEYLRDWGVRDPDVIASQSRDIVDQALLALAAQTDDTRNLAEIALGIAVDRISAALVVRPESSAASGLVPQACVVAEVSHILEEFPELANQAADSSAEVSGLLATIAAPVVPQSKRSEMPSQPGTRVWRAVSPSYYQGLARRIALAFREPVQGSETIA